MIRVQHLLNSILTLFLNVRIHPGKFSRKSFVSLYHIFFHSWFTTSLRALVGKISTNDHNSILIANLTTVFPHKPCLAEVKRLSLDFLWVYVYWEKTGHFFNRPVKLGRSLHVREMRKWSKVHTPINKAKLWKHHGCYALALRGASVGECHIAVN